MKILFSACGIIKNKNNEILLSSRRKKNILKNYWEFPGGKLENYENFNQALIREVKEEINIKILNSDITPLIFVRHKYRDFYLFMYVFKIKKWRGDLESCDKEELKWVKPYKLKKEKILPANKDIVKLLI